MPVLERGEPDAVLVVLDLVTLGTEPGDGGVRVTGLPQDHGVEGQAEGGELVLLAFPVCLPDLGPGHRGRSRRPGGGGAPGR